jgi:hypothetical protein
MDWHNFQNDNSRSCLLKSWNTMPAGAALMAQCGIRLGAIPERPMSTTIKHRKVTIVTLDAGETIADHCRAGNIAIVQESDGWWTHFVGENGASESYDVAFDSYNQALWAAKAAAEFDSE